MKKLKIWYMLSSTTSNFWYLGCQKTLLFWYRGVKKHPPWDPPPGGVKNTPPQGGGIWAPPRGGVKYPPQGGGRAKNLPRASPFLSKKWLLLVPPCGMQKRVFFDPPPGGGLKTVVFWPEYDPGEAFNFWPPPWGGVKTAVFDPPRGGVPNWTPPRGGSEASLFGSIPIGPPPGLKKTCFSTPPLGGVKKHPLEGQKTPLFWYLGGVKNHLRTIKIDGFL